jgi:two-component system, NarL family, response regulator LiaR
MSLSNSQSFRILIVEDDPLMQLGLKHALSRYVVSQLKEMPANSFTLSDREMEVLKLLVEGHSNAAIAQALFLSESTIKAHLRSIMTKFEVNDRVQVAVIALRSGLIR